jgi:hypothetical protein
MLVGIGYHTETVRYGLSAVVCEVELISSAVTSQCMLG